MKKNQTNPPMKLNDRIDRADSLVCVGLDSDITQIPEQFKHEAEPQFAFNKWIIEQTQEFVCAYKPNLAFYEARGAEGWKDLTLTVEYIREYYPDIFLIADAKLGDVGSSNEAYATAIFGQLQFDAVTLDPYVGKEALQPFLNRKDKVSIVLCKTSSPDSGDLQDLLVGEHNKPLWQVVAQEVSQSWNQNKNCMLVVGATYPEQLAEVRGIVGDMTILAPGIGTQGGDIEKAIKAGLNKDKKGIVINSSRGIIFDKNPRKQARKLREKINLYR